jgi:hypothetical protein
VTGLETGTGVEVGSTEDIGTGAEGPVDACGTAVFGEAAKARRIERTWLV